MFLLHDASCGYTMAVRSASGRSPLFWGADAAGDYALFATSPAGRLSAFPQGCAFEVGPGGPGPQGRSSLGTAELIGASRFSPELEFKSGCREAVMGCLLTIRSVLNATRV